MIIYTLVNSINFNTQTRAHHCICQNTFVLAQFMLLIILHHETSLTLPMLIKLGSLVFNLLLIDVIWKFGYIFLFCGAEGDLAEISKGILQEYYN